MSLSDWYQFDKFSLKDLASRLRADPKRLVLGVDPLSTAGWNALLGRSDQPLVNVFGGPMGSGRLGTGNTGGVYERAQQAGIDTGTAAKGHDAAEIVAGIFGGRGAFRGLSNIGGGGSGDGLQPINASDYYKGHEVPGLQPINASDYYKGHEVPGQGGGFLSRIMGGGDNMPSWMKKSGPAWLQKFNTNANRALGGMQTQPSPYLSAQENQAAQDRQRMAMTAALLQASGPRPRNTTSPLQAFGQAQTAAQQAQDQFTEQALRTRLAVAQLGQAEQTANNVQSTVILANGNIGIIRRGAKTVEDTGYKARGFAQRPVDLAGGQYAFDPASGQVTGELSTPQQETDAAAARAAAETGAEVRARTEAEREAAAPGAYAAASQAIDTLQQFADQAKRVREHPGLSSVVGIFGPQRGATLTWIGGSEGANAAAQIDVLRNQSFINALAAMRAASKTGGAVGNVSDAEGARMENAYIALTQSQTLAEYKANLQRLEETTARAIERLKKAYEDEYREVPNAPAFGGEQQQTPDFSQMSTEQIQQWLKANP